MLLVFKPASSRALRRSHYALPVEANFYAGLVFHRTTSSTQSIMDFRAEAVVAEQLCTLPGVDCYA